MHQGDGSHNNNIKANLPSKFNGRTEDLDLFLDSMATYYAVMNIPADKQAGILRLNLSGNVHLTLTNTNKSNPTFWENPDDIITALKQLYQRPNKCATAQAALKKLNMAGYRLSTYFTKFVSLAGQAEYNTDDAFVKTAFCQGLNNLASRGGLRTQIMPLLKDPNKTLNDIYAEADSIMRNDHGDDFNSKTCAADADVNITSASLLLTLVASIISSHNANNHNSSPVGRPLIIKGINVDTTTIITLAITTIIRGQNLKIKTSTTLT